MATIKANKDKARFVSNTISQDVADGDWVDHEVITKYKLPEIVIDATRAGEFDTFTEVTTGESIWLYDDTTVELADVGTVSETPVGVVLTYNVGSDLTQNVYTFSNDGLQVTWANNNAYLNYQISSGKVYWEIVRTTNCDIAQIGVSSNTTYQTDAFSTSPLGYSWYLGDGNKYNNGVAASYTSTPSITAILGVGYDYNSGVLEFFIDGISQGTAYTLSPSTTVNPALAVVDNQAGHSITMVFNTTHLPSGYTNIQEQTTKYTVPTPNHTIGTPTKAYFNKTIDTTLSAEATGKCKSSTITQIGVL